MPEILHVGVPVQMLANRPDVQAAEMSLAAAYYSTNIARSAFYPNLVISGSAGWSTPEYEPSTRHRYCYRQPLLWYNLFSTKAVTLPT